ncbi:MULTISPECIES: terpene synthase family protein [Streptomyces]|uniref:terpene synthase family protein n=1 Tax=Streptomyces TaxID=1883 RepID=UPI00292F0A4B|nr:terpene synthase family protein [Streptomyces sp. NEAU-HV9]
MKHFTLADLDGADLQIPAPSRQAHMNPHYTQVRDAFHYWLHTFDALPPHLRKAMVAGDFPLLASLCWPTAEPLRLHDITAATAVFTLRDDEIEDHQYQRSAPCLRACLKDARTRHTTVTEQRWGPLLRETWASFGAYLTEPQMDRLCAAESALLRGCLAAAEHFAEGRKFRDLDDFYALRIPTTAHSFALSLMEIGTGHDLGDVLEAEELQPLIRCDAERFVLLDGLVTLRKDLAAGQYAENVTTVVAELHDCPLAEAVHRVRRLYEETTARHEELSADFLASALEDRRAAQALVTAMNDVCSGLSAYSARGTRYTLEQQCP